MLIVLHLRAARANAGTLPDPENSKSPLERMSFAIRVKGRLAQTRQSIIACGTQKPQVAVGIITAVNVGSISFKLVSCTEIVIETSGQRPPTPLFVSEPTQRTKPASYWEAEAMPGGRSDQKGVT
jgi:hypothetical protein